MLDIGNCVLAEAGRDSHWAVGLSIDRDDIFDTNKWKGQNWLGKLLTSIRLELNASTVMYKLVILRIYLLYVLMIVYMQVDYCTTLMILFFFCSS